MMQMSFFEDPTEEEFKKVIVQDLKRGSSFVDGKKRIKEMYKKDITKSERITLLKNEYGVGGHSLTKASGGVSQTHDTTGITIKLYTGEEKHYGWNEIHDLILTLIRIGEY